MYSCEKPSVMSCMRSLASRRIISLSNGEGEGRGVEGRSMTTGSAVMRGLVELSMALIGLGLGEGALDRGARSTHCYVISGEDWKNNFGERPPECPG